MIKSAVTSHHQIITYAGRQTKKASSHHRGETSWCLNSIDIISHGYSRE